MSLFRRISLREAREVLDAWCAVEPGGRGELAVELLSLWGRLRRFADGTFPVDLTDALEGEIRGCYRELVSAFLGSFDSHAWVADVVHVAEQRARTRDRATMEPLNVWMRASMGDFDRCAMALLAIRRLAPPDLAEGGDLLDVTGDELAACRQFVLAHVHLFTPVAGFAKVGASAWRSDLYEVDPELGALTSAWYAIAQHAYDLEEAEPSAVVEPPCVPESVVSELCAGVSEALRDMVAALTPVAELLIQGWSGPSPALVCSNADPTHLGPGSSTSRVSPGPGRLRGATIEVTGRQLVVSQLPDAVEPDSLVLYMHDRLVRPKVDQRQARFDLPDEADAEQSQDLEACLFQEGVLRYELLARLTRAESEEVGRVQAAHLLGMLGSLAALPELELILPHTSASVRDAVVAAIATLRGRTDDT